MMSSIKISFNQLPNRAKKAVHEFYHMEGYESLGELKDACEGIFFSLEYIGMEEAKRRCMELSEEYKEVYNSFEDYHKEYVGEGLHIPNHGSSVYPVIESHDCYDWLDDGWHRFHSYVMHGHTVLPVLKIGV